MTVEYIGWDTDMQKMMQEMELFKRLFGSDVFEGWENGLSKYRRLVRKYSKNNKADFGMAIMTGIFPEMQTASQPQRIVEYTSNSKVITKVDTKATFETKIIDANDVMNVNEEKDEEESTDLNNVVVTSLTDIKLLKSDYFFIDIVYEILWKMKKEWGEKNYCDLTGKSSKFAVEYRAYMEAGRKKRKYNDIEKEPETFGEIGYFIPEDVKLIPKRGKKPEIPNVIPNFYRLISSTREMRGLFEWTDIRKFSAEQMDRMLENANGKMKEYDFYLSGLEYYKIEDFIGVNLATELTEVLVKKCEIANLTAKKMESQIYPVIKEIVKEIMGWQGVYTRIDIIRCIGEELVPICRSEFSDPASRMAERLEKVKYRIECIKRSGSLEYNLFKSLVACVIEQKGNTDEERIAWIENKLVYQFVGGRRDIAYQRMQAFKERVEKFNKVEQDLYSFIQREIIKYYV